jgi:hypothetical protein
MVTECERELARRLAAAKAEIERLNAERVALLNLCVADDSETEPVFRVYEVYAFTGWSGEGWGKPVTGIFRSRADGIAAVLRAAGLGPEAAR